jgi:UDP-N-acetyl-D-galactosamine dehydrogenase
MIKLNELKIGVVGLGYVGLPLAVEIGKRYFAMGFDLKAERINNFNVYTVFIKII